METGVINFHQNNKYNIAITIFVGGTYKTPVSMNELCIQNIINSFKHLIYYF